MYIVRRPPHPPLRVSLEERHGVLRKEFAREFFSLHPTGEGDVGCVHTAPSAFCLGRDPSSRLVALLRMTC